MSPTLAASSSAACSGRNLTRYRTRKRALRDKINVHNNTASTSSPQEVSSSGRAGPFEHFKKIECLGPDCAMEVVSETSQSLNITPVPTCRRPT